MNARSNRLRGIAAVWLCLLGPALAAAPAQGANETASGGRKAPPASRLLERAVAVGASVTHGFGNNLPLARVLDEAIAADHVKVLNASVGLQFLDPVRFGEDQIDRVLEHHATLVVGVDFLFWYGYGLSFRGPNELEHRRKKFREGLRQLDRLACPIVVGDLPDMTGAGRHMLHPAMIPSRPVLEALNRELRTWAASKKNVLVVPLAAWLKTLRAGAWKVPASADGKHPVCRLGPEMVFQWDRLHLSRLGMLVFVDRLVRDMKAHFGPAAAGLRFDLWTAVERERAERNAPKGSGGRGVKGSATRPVERSGGGGGHDGK